jgi:hypothetical protein
VGIVFYGTFGDLLSVFDAHVLHQMPDGLGDASHVPINQLNGALVGGVFELHRKC